MCLFTKSNYKILSSSMMLLLTLFSYRIAIANNIPSASSMQNLPRLNQIYIDQWKVLIANLASCTPGDYQISSNLKPVPNMPNPMYITYKLSGWVNNMCIFNVTFPRSDQSPYMIGECKFSKDTISKIVETFNAITLPTNDLTKMAVTPLLSNQLFNECDIYLYVNGTKRLLPKPNMPINIRLNP